jgi:hypothetical protein
LRAVQLQAERLRHEAQGLDALAAEVATLQESAAQYGRLKFEIEHLAENDETNPEDLRRAVARVETGEQR